jgi:putative transposase
MPNFTRKSNRLSLKELYRGGYWYFVTICTENRLNIFVEEGLPLHPQDLVVSQNKFILNIFGKIVEEEILGLKNKFIGVAVEDFVIMPNHLHLIISMNPGSSRINSDIEVSLGEVVGSLKAHTQKKIRELVKDGGVESGNEFGGVDTKCGNGGVNPPLRNYNKIWKKSFFDHIIRDEKDLDRIQEYILYNPAKWNLDSLNPINQK